MINPITIILAIIGITFSLLVLINFLSNQEFRNRIYTTVRRLYQSNSFQLKLLLITLAMAITAVATYFVADKYRPYKIKEVQVEKPVIVEIPYYSDSTATNLYVVATVVIDSDNTSHLDIKHFYAHNQSEAISRMWGDVMMKGYKNPKTQMWNYIYIK